MKLKLSHAANNAARQIDAVVRRSIKDPDVVLSMDDCVRIASIVQLAINEETKDLRQSLLGALKNALGDFMAIHNSWVGKAHQIAKAAERSARNVIDRAEGRAS